ncbi:DNA mismatch repair protein MutS [Sphingomonas sp. AP4-R1]|uniref:Smr/MutS family protein n=1 Tax=Sphingomonas sp. AP4-R1 TaxID=2735134 RepID=UPI0014939333|nr:Smr/MutS family protein [Sphingomonas sp. AP4-R1]QJU58929.1 DNA mismatch repair protein MutS [Sphingomonas sp. AP4-R1]
MRDRRLTAEERTLWSRVAATVRPLGKRVRLEVDAPLLAEEIEIIRAAPAPRASAPHPAQPTARAVPGETLDGGWDKRLARGLVAPDRSIDLHGHNLAGAHAALDQALARAIADGARLLLIVTGRPPRRGDIEPKRGLIRASIGDWLALSPHAGRIAAVRNAHPRHGGAGALYVVLRRKR